MAGVGVPPGLAGAGVGEVGEARAKFNRMVKGVTKLKEISENVAGGFSAERDAESSDRTDRRVRRLV